jgi:hypothetical protein
LQDFLAISAINWKSLAQGLCMTGHRCGVEGVGSI